MRFISIDTETTGLDSEIDQVIEFGAVLVDTNTHPSTWPTYHRIIKHERYSGNAYAIQLNNRLFRILAGVDKTDIPVIYSNDLTRNFQEFLLENGYTLNGRNTVSFVVAGKNIAGFDMPFLKKISGWDFRFSVAHRTIDPGAMYINFTTDEKPPDLLECKKRAGINTQVTHNALEDAWDVVYIICAKMGWDFSKAITLDYINNKYKKMGDEEELFWSFDDKHILAGHSEGDMFNKFFIQDIITGDRQYVWNTNEI